MKSEFLMNKKRCRQRKREDSKVIARSSRFRVFERTLSLVIGHSLVI
jgi:hypothetical protein